MSHSETLTRYVANFVDELYKSGLTDVVISPGSRSTPLAMTFAEYPSITHWVNMDERSAGFFALGMAKQENKPVALVCTSGTAAANYYPAIVEAYYGRVPLLVLTADRPHELRDVGAPQAIEQLNMYRDYVKWFHEMSLPDMSPSLLNYVRSKAARAYYTAGNENPGPVHLNFPFREPLLPDFSVPQLWGDDKKQETFHHLMDGERKLTTEQLDSLASQLREFDRGLIVCGPQVDCNLGDRIAALAEEWNLPVLADPLSQLRAGHHSKANIIECYDAILKSKQIRDQLSPEFIIRFGAMPVSKPYLLFVKEKPSIVHYVVEPNSGFREPAGIEAQFIFADPAQLCRDLVQNRNHSYDKSWLQIWKSLNEQAKQLLLEEKESNKLTEGHVVKYLADAVPIQSTLYVGNSMAIRDVDTFFMNTNKQMKVIGNRGANGIDGLTSSALGAAAHGEHVTLLIGDLSFYHDLNGLLVAKHYNLSLTVVLVNNNGGGIFSFLPQANEDDKHFEVLFGTPLDIDFKHIIGMYKGDYYKPQSWEQFTDVLRESYNQSGVTIIEIETDRNENTSWHKQKWQEVEKCLVEYMRGD
ncbi:2-succinyl-5-enolpyruvyl-6-hydroxy-3-cyclohexene-1-carboxylic-acid synthase [Aquibacillus albus]|uniref:2-succinyl-5-enolpyruvyl-6-hydroxy-3-cyclohexene-1-carboxylate synthase n=1 Tax=Aquibacillus albus TaxID=1168171 RepID=A0ABS2MYD4_9BACI|nr:2-succinyl-5-enolpyruvyl-6-hydroxy-3-cyclohexene-1-carboxylic-acid synthase [Aquibacillus albus]MBM7570909.1 2-succinyl-5-enolpyruvyl-6-hydroxy-3-cyclohexene-1-carboxylate synthase [Aquibacillus albus]